MQLESYICQCTRGTSRDVINPSIWLMCNIGEVRPCFSQSLVCGTCHRPIVCLALEKSTRCRGGAIESQRVKHEIRRVAIPRLLGIGTDGFREYWCIGIDRIESIGIIGIGGTESIGGIGIDCLVLIEIESYWSWRHWFWKYWYWYWSIEKNRSSLLTYKDIWRYQ
jgi:hypothetical protein